MNEFPEDIHENIFQFLTADSMKNTLLVNTRFRNIADTQYIWNKVYKNTIPEKFIDYGHSDFRNLLHQHLRVLKHTEWFKRQLFLKFVFEKVVIDENAYTRVSELTTQFQKYSNNKFCSIPNTYYWDNLEDGHNEKVSKMILLSKSSEYIDTRYNGKYIHWVFPKTDEIIHNLMLKD